MIDAETLWLDTLWFARCSLLRMNGTTTDEEVIAMARKIYAKMKFLTKPVGRKK